MHINDSEAAKTVTPRLPSGRAWQEKGREDQAGLKTTDPDLFPAWVKSGSFFRKLLAVSGHSLTSLVCP